MAEKFQLSPVHMLQELEDKFLCFHVETGKCFQLNETSYKILSSCDIPRTIEEIYIALGGNCSEHPEELEYVEECIKSAISLGIVSAVA